MDILGLDLEMRDIGFALSFAGCMCASSGLSGGVAAYMATLHYDFTRSLGNVFVPSVLLGATVFVVSV